MSAHPCPLCGESKGYDEAGGGSLYCSACCRRVATNTAVSPRFRADNDTAWNATAAHAQGLRDRIAELEAQLASAQEMNRKLLPRVPPPDLSLDPPFPVDVEGDKAERAHGIEEVKR